MALLAALALTSACKQGGQPATNTEAAQQPKEVKCEYVDDGKPSMRKAFDGKFLIGAAVNTRQVVSTDPKVINAIRNNFSALVPENCMKPEEIHPKKDLYDWGDADALVELAQRNGQVLTGHCLIWHSQVPYWFFKDDMAQPVTREELINRMKEHITTVVQHFKGKIKGWDVVNEAVMEDGSLRKSQFYNIIGPDFIKLAFQRVDGIGMQSHVSFNTNLDEYEKSIVAYAAEGVKVMVTELDLSVLPWPKGNYGAAVETNFEYMKEMNPYTDGLPAEKAQEQTDFFVKLFGIYLKHADIIDRVTFWGVTDGDSWKNGWPMPGRTDYPLAIDRNYQPKPFVDAIIKLAEGK